MDKQPMELIHKLLFEQRVRTNTGSFFDSIALQIEQLVGDEEEVSYIFFIPFYFKVFNCFNWLLYSYPI